MSTQDSQDAELIHTLPKAVILEQLKGICVQRPYALAKWPEWATPDMRDQQWPGEIRDEVRCAAKVMKGPFRVLKYNERPRCSRPVMKDCMYCPRHQRHNLRRQELSGYPQMYRVLNGELLNRLRHLDDQAENELSARKELRLMRASAQDAVTTYEASLLAVALAEESGDPKAKDMALNIRDAAAQQMRQLLRENVAVLEATAKIEQMTSNQYSPVAVREILSQVVRIMADVCERNEITQEVAVEFQKRLRDQIKVSDSIIGTTILPSDIDRDVLSMDDTIPLVESNMIEGTATTVA